LVKYGGLKTDLTTSFSFCRLNRKQAKSFYMSAWHGACSTFNHVQRRLFFFPFCHPGGDYKEHSLGPGSGRHIAADLR